ncbi:hypothetical protein JTE90_029288 [Oedothorax gibbosus]|uniref:GDP-fucose protein O-fucosyltransferase 1 n=1 Tax=Oedothorax gibbosus TaxID=931172 RepID=A0AAV6U2K5_9ARAC|nr:hypothetical protein JTE90_029288 [Oedothorax gibbosus]
MGRFGNQADHFLGSLAFAKALNRTLALPPWVEYKTGYLKSLQVPFDTYFKVEPLQEFHRVVTMEYFMKHLADIVWPKGKRKVLCYSARGNSGGCNAKDGNPFGPFWDTFGVDFDESIFYQPLHYDVHFGDTTKQWIERFPSDQFPVLAFTGAPATFPVREEDRPLHRYLVWSETIKKAAVNFISSMKPRGPFVGIHLRNGQDWERACEHIEHSPLLFSAPQCLGWRGEMGKATPELCMPTKEIILRQLRSKVKALKARSVFVASDNDHMIIDIESQLKDLKVRAYKLAESRPHVDLAIMGLSNHFIANCISSFSAFAIRERDANGLQSSFWAFPIAKSPQHQEL